MTQAVPSLKQLDALIGQWEMQTSVDGQFLGQGQAVFEWLEGGAFLVQHADAHALPQAPAEWVENSPFPVTTLIGLDDSSGAFTMLYADARNVYRVYQMSLRAGIWKIWRYAPGFSQRFTGVFSQDGHTITAYWESSSDGVDWEHDFDLTYTKLQ